MRKTRLLLLTLLCMTSMSALHAQTSDLRVRTILEETPNGEARTAQTTYRAAENTEAITAAPPFNATSSVNRGPNGATRYQITLAFYSAAELAAAGFQNGGTFTSLGFIYASANTVARDSVNGNIKFYLLNSTDTSGTNYPTNWATATAPATVVYDGPITLPAVVPGQVIPFDVTLTTPFTYTGGSIYLMYEYTNPTNPLIAASATYQSNSTTIPAGLITRNATSLTALPTTLGPTATFRPVIRWGYDGPPVPDAEVLGLYAYGFTSRDHSANPITALVRNNGSVNLTYTATLTVRDSATGTIKFTDNTTFANVNMTGGEIDTLVFTNWTPSVSATDTISISIAVTSGTDPNLANNVAGTRQVVTSDRVSHRQNIPTTLGVGTTMAGGADIAVKMRSNGAKVITSLSSLFTPTGQSITFGIWTANINGTPGTRIWTSAPQTTNGGVLTVSVPNIAVNGDFFVGATQTTATNFGMGYQVESVLRPNTFYFASPTGGTFSPLNPPFRISIDAVLDNPPPPPVLAPFSLVAPPNNASVTVSQFSSAPINITWTASGTGTPTYKWLYWVGTASGAPTLSIASNASGFDTVLTLTSSGVDGILASLGLNPGDSVQGQWRVFAYSTPTDSLGSTQTFNITLRRAPRATAAILVDTTVANMRVSRDTLISYLNATGRSFDVIQRGDNASTITIPSLTGYPFVFLLGEAANTASPNTRTALRNYLQNGTPSNKARLIIFAEDFGWNHDRTGATARDTILTRELLGVEYLADRPAGTVTGIGNLGNERIINVGLGVVDSVAGAFPDVFRAVRPNTTVLYRFQRYTPTSDSVSSIGRNEAGYASAVFGFDLRRYRAAFDSPPLASESVGAALTRLLESATFFVQTGVALPVELVSFTGEVRDGAVHLAWRTASELNNAGFEVERKSQGGSWNTLGFVRGAGTTTEAQSYTFVDNSASGTVQYRLKQVDFDGQFEYSNIIEVNAGLPKTFALEQNYPNPFNPTTVIAYQLPVASEVKLEVYDVLGRKVMTLVNGRQDAGAYNFTLNAGNLSSGVYFYRLQASATNGASSSNFVQTKKMMLIK
ncbi:MAG: T9SS type A sorting domain-containing protein [Chloroherpetonaceae bacterium]